MNTVGRLTSSGIMQVFLRLDELSYESGSVQNVGLTTSGILYASLFDENLSLELNSNTPLRIKNNKNIVVYDYFDEYTLNPLDTGIFGDIKSLSPVLASISNVTSTSFSNVQSEIQSYNSSFNVFAVVSRTKNSQSLQGVGSANGKYTFTDSNFVYNTSSANILSTGNTIVDMSGGAALGLPDIDGKKWMAMSVYNGDTNGFVGTILWIFTNDVIDNLGNVTVDGKVVTTTQSIFYPTLGQFEYMKIYQVIIDSNGDVISTNTSENAGWNFSTNQLASSTGYYSTSAFSFDDGLWAQVIGGNVSGNTGPTYRVDGGYGLGNFNSTDPSSRLYWNGADVGTNNYVGFVYTGDA